MPGRPPTVRATSRTTTSAEPATATTAAIGTAARCGSAASRRDGRSVENGHAVSPQLAHDQDDGGGRDQRDDDPDHGERRRLGRRGRDGAVPRVAADRRAGAHPR